MIPLLGIDVSHWQGEIHWQKAKAAGLDFCFIKATQGVDILDPKFKGNWCESGNVGLLRGVYHFYEYTRDPIKQADFLLETTGSDPGEIGFVLDAEAMQARPPVTYSEDLRRFCEHIEQNSGNRPIIYMAFAFWSSVCPAATWARRYRLWIANYNYTAPKVPLPWAPLSITFWQFTDRGPGPVYGMQSKQVDMNIWRAYDS
jgi:lysozyme